MKTWLDSSPHPVPVSLWDIEKVVVFFKRDDRFLKKKAKNFVFPSTTLYIRPTVIL